MLDLKEAFDDPHLAAREMLVRTDGGDGPAHLGIPIKFREEPGKIAADAPALGQHSTAILRELGYDEAACKALADEGIVPPGGVTSGGCGVRAAAHQANDLRRRLHMAEIAVEILDGVGMAARRHRGA